MLGGQNSDKTNGIETRTPRAPCNLVEFTRTQMTHLASVKLHQGSEQNRANRDIDTDSKGVSSADNREQTLLGQALNEAPVARQHSRVVNPNPVSKKATQSLPKALRKGHRGNLTRNLRTNFRRNELAITQSRGRINRIFLGKMNDVDRVTSL